ncbi:MAG: hypothetical protein KBF12_12195 [Sebaldella sp.]|nr:hypothetical protein [Sebaldella sp.]
MKKFKRFLIVGIISLAVGLFIVMTNKDQNENNLQIAQNATSAQEAAQLISRNNRSEVGGHMLGMFLIGLGAALSGASVIGMIAEKNKKKKV